MATQFQLRRGTTSDHATFTGAVGEVTYDSSKKTIFVHDGSTAGGHEIARADVSNVVNPQFSGTESIGIPVGTDAQRPSSPTVADIRYNTTTNVFEYYTTDANANAWVSFGPFLQIRFNGQNGSVFEANGNYSSVSRLSEGRYRITFANAEPNTNYMWMIETDTNVSRTGNHVGPTAGLSGNYFSYGTTTFTFTTTAYSSGAFSSRSDSEIVWVSLFRLPA